MCGIVGIVSQTAFPIKDLLASLKRLEYRGYDSFGFATDSGIIEKRIGGIVFDVEGIECKAALAHTRWATHGGVTMENAHPHSDCSGSLFIVHNGILENYAEMKKDLESRGHKFNSGTDSEAIAHYFEEKFTEKTPELAISDFLAIAKGTFAILILQKGSEKLYAIKKDSPLVLGITDGMSIIASDIFAFPGRIKNAVFLDDNEFASVSGGDAIFYNKDADQVDKLQVKIASQQDEPLDDDHFMIKEIRQQPESARRLLGSLKSGQRSNLEGLQSEIRKAGKIIFLASGSSYHACLLGVYFLHKAGIDAQAIIASEFGDYSSVSHGDLVVAVSQSGETMDVIDALKAAKSQGARIASIVNTQFSTIQRMSSASILMEAGHETCVAATKTFTNEVLLLASIAQNLGYKTDLGSMPEKISAVLAQEQKLDALARRLAAKKDIYIIGRGMSYPVAREVALKLKEISYIHAEGMMGGELKHGTLALIEESTPVIALINRGDSVISNVNEAQARGAEIIAITSEDVYDGIRIPSENEAEFAILCAIAGQLLTYHIARQKGLPIDKPRNLAKSVTVK